ncbi:MAG: anaerobic glycerol-3-phosphate dehydrogenase subunit A [Solirubrobacterales bacterium]|nr:anaerobic glycerol-3-phosphate dehydrogenase subunit A [Solirubrobacterales bacterium]
MSVPRETDVLVIGGGTTGAGVAWDASLRGHDVVLVDRSDLAMGTSGRFHGLLHSGGRYAVKDRPAAEECIVENRVLRRIAADAVEDTGGLFVTTVDDDPAYGDALLAGCLDVGIEAAEIPVAEALRDEPRLTPTLLRAFTVPDAAIDVWKLVDALARAAREQGARILAYHSVVALHVEGDRVVGARLRDELSGEESDVRARVTVNASGAWAGRVAGMAGCEGVEVLPGKGIMIAMNHRLVHTVINRCAMPADGDILVPIRTVSVIGTTDIRVKDPDELDVTQEEVNQMLDDGERLVPGFRQARALRVWAGARPLFRDAKQAGVEDTRNISRSHALLDHAQRDGVGGFVTITGGKLTSFRLMAQETVDAAVAQLDCDEGRPCATASTPLPGSEGGETYHLGERLARREERLLDDQLICECEMVTRGQLEAAMRAKGTANLDDLRRSVRLGMGPCQGGFCIPRAAGILHAERHVDAAQASGALHHFLQERWKGVWPILHGDNLRQSRLDDWIFQGVLGVNQLPGDASRLPSDGEAEGAGLIGPDEHDGPGPLAMGEARTNPDAPAEDGDAHAGGVIPARSSSAPRGTGS